MEALEYERLYAAEEKLWWFRAMHTFITRILPEQSKRHNLLALDIGCGTGLLVDKLTSQGYRAMGLDSSPIALSYAARRDSKGLVRANANCLPFASAFDVVVTVDVLEVEHVNPQGLVNGALRALKPGGLGLFVMAAHQRLLSEHDRAVGSVRRYNLAQLKNLLARPGITILRATYLFFFLFPILAARKLLNPTRGGAQDSPTRSDVNLLPAVINEPLFWLCLLEARLLSVFNLPMGSSALVLLRKDG
ncbi:MAG: class I SAM-dependent methyltransferase [Chloroflexi bacterium]|nr:class I SAM-dependent methyltransferase [Chloroflexota bacterium]